MTGLAELAAALGNDEEAVGLLLHSLPGPSGYDQTPDGAVTFAFTGGDGVHFSFLSGSEGPVVMTVPMQFDEPNIIVGADLRDFLGLGLAAGYFALEGIAYRRAETAAWLDAGAPGSDADPRVLDRIARRTGATRWRDHLSHLDSLAARFGALIG